MKKTFIAFVMLVLGTMCLLSSGCTITPGVNVGLSLDYYGGSFHVRPNASIGIYGHP
jgi:hypothetical protein